MKTAILILTLFIPNLVGAQNDFPSVGEKAKNFSLKTVNGEKVKLKDINESKNIVLIVLRGWPEYQCPICSRQVGELIASSEVFKEKDAAVLMVYPGPAKQLTNHANEFIKSFEFPTNYYFTLDPEYYMIKKYGLRWEAKRETAYPATLVINKEGEIVFAKISKTHGGRSTIEEIVESLEKL